MLTRTFNPVDPDTLLVDDSQIDVPVDDLSGMGTRLSNLSSGDKVFFARVRDGAGNLFLRGCTAAPLRRGQTRVEIVLEYLTPPSDGGPDAGADAGGSDAGADAGPDAGPPMLEITVREVLEPTVRIPGAEVVVTDGTTTLQGTTNGSGQVALVATGLGSSFTVTAVGETGVAGDIRRAATTLYAVAPAFSGTPSTATITVPLEASDAVVGGGGSISGAVSGVPGGGDVDVLVRTPFAGPFAMNLGADAPYTLGGLRVDETYSEAALFHDSGGVLVGVGANLALALSTASPTLTGIDYALTAAAPVNIGATVTIPSVPAAYGPTPSFALDLVLPRGAVTLDSDPSAGVGSAFAELVPDLGVLPLGARILFRAAATGAGGSVAGEAREERSSTGGVVDAVLIIPAPPTVSTPADGSAVPVATARAMSVTLGGQFAGYDVVHARFEGTMGGTTYRWNLVAPAPSSALALPAMPVGLEALQPGVGYTLVVEVLTVSGTTFVYGTEIGVDWTDAVSALNVPQRAGRTVTFSVVP